MPATRGLVTEQAAEPGEQPVPIVLARGARRPGGPDARPGWPTASFPS